MNAKREPVPVAAVIGQLMQGGSERQLYWFLKHCDRDRWAPIVYVSRGPTGFWDGPIHELGIPIVMLHGGAPSRMWQFRQSCIQHRVRHCFSWAAHTNVYGLALRGLDISCVGSFRNSYDAELGDRYRWLRSWASMAAVSTVVCNSAETAATVLRRAGGQTRVVYIPNCVQPVADIESCRRAWRERLSIHEDQALVLGVGRLSAQKNFGRFIQAIAIVRQTVPVQAVVAGRDDGVLEGLQAQVRLYGLQGAIRFIGPVDDARELVCAADVFLLSSDYEGMPNVVLEAMAAGTPCVCTPVNGVSDLIQSGANGFIAGFQADELAEKVRCLVEDSALRREMGTRARKCVDGSLAPPVIAARLWQLLE